jgi:hypothetical protein
MSAQLRVLAADQSTIITSANLGNILTPGSSSNVKFYLQNFGDQTCNNVTVSIGSIAANDGSLYAFIAADISGAPDTFGPGPLVVGNVGVLASVPFWSKVITMQGLDPSNNPRRYALVCQGTST